MLNEASKRIKEKKCKNIDLILADHETIWTNLDFTFDRITSAGVLQYLKYQEIDQFIINASKCLNKEGKIVFFDILDPRLYPLWKMGIFSKDANFWKILRKTGFEFQTMVSANLKNCPKDILGYAHNPYIIEKIANKHGFKMICVRSMYYEYKYHAIMFRT